VTPVTIRQMFTFKTTIEGNTGSFMRWFFALAVPGNVLIYLFNVLTNSFAYRHTTGIWLEAAIELAIFTTALIIAQRKCAHLLHLDG
jgi:hypothetical protein